MDYHKWTNHMTNLPVLVAKKFRDVSAIAICLHRELKDPEGSINQKQNKK